MQVRLKTVVETIIDIDPENNASYEEAKGEIFGRLHEIIKQDADQDQFVEAVQSLHTSAVVFDTVRTQSVTHSFEEVK